MFPTNEQLQDYVDPQKRWYRNLVFAFHSYPILFTCSLTYNLSGWQGAIEGRSLAPYADSIVLDPLPEQSTTSGSSPVHG